MVGVFCKVLWRWWLLGLAVKRWGPGGPIVLASWTGRFRTGKVVWALSRCLTIESSDYFMPINEWQVCSLRLEVDLGPVLYLQVLLCLDSNYVCLHLPG